MLPIFKAPDSSDALVMFPPFRLLRVRSSLKSDEVVGIYPNIANYFYQEKILSSDLQGHLMLTALLLNCKRLSEYRCYIVLLSRTKLT